jgi:hypothetical protein
LGQSFIRVLQQGVPALRPLRRSSRTAAFYTVEDKHRQDNPKPKNNSCGQYGNNISHVIIIEEKKDLLKGEIMADI